MSKVTMQRPRSAISGRSPQKLPAAAARPTVAGKADTEMAALDGFGLRREELARLTGFSLRALADWVAGKPPSEPARRRFREVRRLFDALLAVVRREALGPWLRAPNPAFQGMTPLQVIENGESDRLWLMVHELGSGEPG